MKKILALVLSVVLLIGSVSGTFTAFAETAQDATEHFENLENWHLEKKTSNTVTLGSGIPASWASNPALSTLVTDSSVVYDANSTASVKLACTHQAAWVDFPDLKPNTNYHLTFNYSAPNGLTDGYVFSSIGIYSSTVGGTTADVKISGGDFYPSDGFFVRKSFVSQTSYTSVDGTKANAVQMNQTTMVANTSDAWHTMTLSFNSGNFNDFVMLFTMAGVDPVHLDNFNLVAEDYFETESNWRVDAYTNDPANATIGYKDAFANAKVTRSDVFANDGRDVVMNVFTPSQFTSIMLPDLEANKDYTLSFEYYAEVITDGTVFERVGIYAPDVEGANFKYENKGFIIDLLKNGGYTTTDFENYVGTSQNTQSTAGVWNNMTLQFNSGELGRLALVFISKVDTEHSAYIDNMKLEEVIPPYVEEPTHFETLDNWHLEKKSSNAVALGTGTPSNWNWATVKSNSERVYNEMSSSSVAVSCNYHAAWLDLPDLQEDTEYTVTFNYSADTYSGTAPNQYVFESAGIYSPTVGGSSADVKISGSGTFAPNNGYFVRKSYTSESSFASVDGTVENAVAGATSNVSNTSDTWHTMSFTFDSGKLNDFILIFTFGDVATVYVDNFTLTEKEKPNYFETEENWRVDAYTNDPANATIGYKDAFANAKVTRSTAFAEEGRDAVMKVYTPSQFTSIILPELEANCDYTLSFEYYGEAITAGAVFSRLGIYAPDVEGANFQWQNKGFIFDILKDGGYTTTNFEKYVGTSQNTAQTVAEEWHTISITFNSGNLGRLALVFISAIDTDHSAYVDNFTLAKGEFDIGMAADNAISFKGNSIRKQNEDLPQGLRFKFFMDKDYETLYAKQGYTAVEVGILAISEAYIGENELLLGGEYSYNGRSYSPVGGVVSEENYQYDENDSDNVYFTAALINIGKNTAGTGKINYSAYSKNIVVRAYTVYEDENGNRTIVYGKQQTANVFEVVYAILSAPQSDADKEAAESAIVNCLDEYEAWVAENHPAA